MRSACLQFVAAFVDGSDVCTKSIFGQSGRPEGRCKDGIQRMKLDVQSIV